MIAIPTSQLLYKDLLNKQVRLSHLVGKEASEPEVSGSDGHINKIHLTQTACLGHCSLANVVLLLFDGQSFWFHSLDTEEQVLAIYNYVEAMLEADSALPPPAGLIDNVFNGFTSSESSETYVISLTEAFR